MFGSLGFTELILILVIVLIIFGAGKLPQLGEGVGKAIKGFKKSVQEAEAYDVDPAAQAQEGTTPGTGVPPQIPQTMQTQSSSPHLPSQPEDAPAVHSEPVGNTAKV